MRHAPAFHLPRVNRGLHAIVATIAFSLIGAIIALALPPTSRPPSEGGAAAPDGMPTSAAAAAGQPTPTATPAPSPSGQPSATIAPTPQPAPAWLGYRQVAATALNVRAQPSAQAELLGTLGAGTVVSVVESPVEAEGYAWYAVVHGAIGGWAAGSDGTDDWLVPVPPATNLEVALRVDWYADVWGPGGTAEFVLYADGRLVQRAHEPLGPGPLEPPWYERWLTHEGLAAFMAQATSSGLLEEDAEFLTPVEGHNAGYGTTEITIVDDGRTTHVAAITATAAPEARAIVALGDMLIAIARDLPPAWLVDDRRDAWEPFAYTLTVEQAPGILDGRPPDAPMETFPLTVEKATLPLGGELLEIGDPISRPGETVIRCSVIDGAAAIAIREALYDAGYPRAEFDMVWTEFRLAWTETRGVVTLRLAEVPPGDPASCDVFE